MDKRTKEYKEMIKNKNLENKEMIESEWSAVDGTVSLGTEKTISLGTEEKDNTLTTLQKEVKELKDMIQSIGKITVNNSNKMNKLPEISKRGKGAAQRKVTTPRSDEYKVLNKFLLNTIAGLISHEKELCQTIGVHRLKKDVKQLLEVCKKSDYIREIALEMNITKDFLTVIIPENKD